MKKKGLSYCDFCGKCQNEVTYMIKGIRTVAICDECVAVAAMVVIGKREQANKEVGR